MHLLPDEGEMAETHYGDSDASPRFDMVNGDRFVDHVELPIIMPH